MSIIVAERPMSEDHRIERIELYLVRMHLVSPWATAYGSDDAVESLVVRMVSDGLDGWGEANAFQQPTYCSEYSPGLFHVAAHFLAPRLIGQSIAAGGDIQRRLAVYKGHPFAKAAFDLAWWDMAAKRAAQPLWKFIGGKAPVVAPGEDFGVTDSVERLIDQIARAVDRGFPRVKLKVKPGWDLPVVRAVRKRFPALTVHVDCNAAYVLNDADVLAQLDELDLAMIEQPLAHDDLIDHAQLQECIDTPICLDESITSPDKARKAVAIGACRFINIKPGRVGGLTPALQIHDACRSHGIPCWVGGMLDSGLGAHAGAALATLDNMRYPPDIFPSRKFHRRELASSALELSAELTMTLPEIPGLGCAPVPAALNEMTIEAATLEM